MGEKNHGGSAIFRGRSKISAVKSSLGLSSLRLTRMPRPRLTLLVVALGWWLASLASTAAEPMDNRTLVTVPSGVTTVLLNSEVTQQIACAMKPNTTLKIALSVKDAEEKQLEAEANQLVTPHMLVFDASSISTDNKVIARNFTLFGTTQGRYYLSFDVFQGGEDYRLSATSSVVIVAEASELGWQGIWYELGANTAMFSLAMAFFVWRRLHQVDLPIWSRGDRPRGLFERGNFDDDAPEIFHSKYEPILGATVKERAKKFWNTSCSGVFAGFTCGIPAALSMKFHVEAGHLFALLSVFSLGVMLPVNYLSGNSQTSTEGDTFQQTTLSNVPLHSSWYWVHVGYCYVVAAGIIRLLVRQEALASSLREIVRERLVGARSSLITSGLPPTMTYKTLKAILNEIIQTTSSRKANRIKEVAIVYDLRRVHSILAHRRDLALDLQRTEQTEEAYAAGTLSWNLVCCPGSNMVPSLSEIVSWYARCRPCRYALRCGQNTPKCSCYCCKCCCPRHQPSADTTQMELEDEHHSCCCSLLTGCFSKDTASASAKMQLLIDELDFFPDEVLKVYSELQCAGRAFVTFDSPQTRNTFVRLVRSRSFNGRMINAVESFASRIRGLPRPTIPDASVSELDKQLPNISVTSAPEPADVIWENVAVRQNSLKHLAKSTIRHMATLVLLLLFSTPTAVLVYIRLDSSSDFYSGLERRHSLLMTMAAAYLPSLLLIAVNWCLLTFLYWLSMSEPAISESKRTKSFLIKGFIYLIVSSVFLPSIGVTVAYLAVTGLENREGNGYVESFLYKVSGTFFISYVCQRAFLGAILDITRAGERLALHPWLLARAVTEDERQRATRPGAYSYGHDYALVLSVLLVALLGTVITPLITPFGALYFYLKFATNKYNFFYVLPYSPGRGHIAQTAHALTLVCLLLFEFTMAFVLLHVAGRPQFIAIIILLVATGAFYVLQLSSVGRIVKRSLLFSTDTQFKVKSDDEGDEVVVDEAQSKTSMITRLRRIFRRRPKPPQEDRRWHSTSYADPYKVTLSIFKRFGVNQVHRMASERTQMRYAFLRLRQHAEEQSPPKSCCESCGRRWGRRQCHEHKVSETTHLV